MTGKRFAATAWQASLMGLLMGSLVACGGGGGGSAGSNPDGGGAYVSVTGLVPAAPTLGDTLLDDATVLRPLREGASWRYSRTSVDGSGYTTGSNSMLVEQFNVSADGATEKVTGGAAVLDDTSTVTISSGTVKSVEQIDFANTGLTETVTAVQLRSPLRVGDQYVIWDKHYENSGYDADGDGTADSMDVAMYARVIGEDTVVLPNLPTQQAVRVDTSVLVRMKTSRNGQFAPTFRTVAHVWYVKGIGIVRRDVASDIGGLAAGFSQETLKSWDGVTEGLGMTDPVPLVVPITNQVFAGQRMTYVNDAKAFDFGDHVLLLTGPPGGGSGVVASTMNLSGKMHSMFVVPGLDSTYGTWLKAADRVLFLRPSQSYNFQDITYTLTALDPNGKLMDGPNPAVIDLRDGLTGDYQYYASDVQAAIDGSTLWLSYAMPRWDPNTGTVHELMLRPFSLNGTPLAAPVLLDSGIYFNGSRISAANGRVLVTWQLANTPNVSVSRYASSSVGAQPTIKTLASFDGFSGGGVVQPVATPTGAALLWSYFPGTGPVYSFGGVLLDDQLQPVRTGPDWIDESLPAIAATGTDLPSVRVQGSRIYFYGQTGGYGGFVPYVSWLDVGATPLAKTTAFRVIGNPGSSLGMAQIIREDRVLLFTNNGAELSTSILWLKPGTAAQ